MTLALTYKPLYPLAGELVTLALEGGVGDPNYARFEITSVPSRSAIVPGLLVDGTGAFIKTFTPDIDGKYEVTPYDIRAYLGQPSHEGDAGGAPRLVVAATTVRTTVHVVSPVDLRIATLAGHDSTLRLGVHELAIRSAALVDPATDLARLAALDATVAGAVEALVDTAVSTYNTTVATRVAALRTAYEAHRTNSGGVFHASADTTNVTNFEPPASDDAAIACLQDLYAKIIGHELAGASGGTWHTNDDTRNNVATPSPLTKAQATVVLADLEERVYERHRVQTATPTVHGAADNTNTLAAPNLLTTAIVAYLDFIASNAAVEIDNENEALGTIERVLGVEAAPR